MTNKRRAVSGFLAIPAACMIVFSVASLPSGSMAADTSQHQAKKVGDVAAHRHDIVEGPHVEGHIAFLHAELGITEDQETQWAAVAAAMRQDVENLQETRDKVAGETHSRLNAIQYLRNRVLFAKLRAQGEQRFLEALEPLYRTFSDDQKRMADELLIPNAPEEQ